MNKTTSIIRNGFPMQNFIIWYNKNGHGEEGYGTLILVLQKDVKDVQFFYLLYFIYWGWLRQGA